MMLENLTEAMAAKSVNPFVFGDAETKARRQSEEKTARVEKMREWIEVMGDELERDDVCLTSLLDPPVHA